MGEWEEKYARQVAHVIGPLSGAAQALDELERRRAQGEDVTIGLGDRMWIVEPASLQRLDRFSGRQGDG